MLKLNGDDFTTGRAKFLDDVTAGAEPSAKIFVRILVGNQDTPVFAQLDTGSPWSILATEIAEETGLLGDIGVETKLSTREGSKVGRLVTVNLTMLADDGQGDSLEIPEAKVFVCADWPIGRSFIGYSGLIETIRIGLDAQQNYFYFGSNGLS